MAHFDRIRERIDTPREYGWGTVELTIVPNSNMRWFEWAYAAQSLRRWLLVYDSVDMDFDVVVPGARIVGTGRLTSVL